MDAVPTHRAVAMIHVAALCATFGTAAYAQTGTDPLRLTLDCEQARALKFRVTLHNMSVVPTAAVVGTIIGNDKWYVPDHLELTVRRPGDSDTHLHYFDPTVPAAIAGRLDAWLITLPAAGSYSIAVPVDPREMFSGPADLQAQWTTRANEPMNSDVQGQRAIHVWIGTLTSDWIHVPDDCRR
jgi:hypothetical protein